MKLDTYTTGSKLSVPAGAGLNLHGCRLGCGRSMGVDIFCGWRRRLSGFDISLIIFLP